MDVISQRKSTLSSSPLNPNAPLFVPLAYRTVEDFSDQWWALVQSSPWFREYWLRERNHDPQNDLSINNIDELFLSDLEALVGDCEKHFADAGEKKGVCGDLIPKGALKWRKSKTQTETPRFAEKAKKIVNVKVSPRMIQQPR